MRSGGGGHGGKSREGARADLAAERHTMPTRARESGCFAPRLSVVRCALTPGARRSSVRRCGCAGGRVSRPPPLPPPPSFSRPVLPCDSSPLVAASPVRCSSAPHLSSEPAAASVERKDVPHHGAPAAWIQLRRGSSHDHPHSPTRSGTGMRCGSRERSGGSAQGSRKRREGRQQRHQRRSTSAGATAHSEKCGDRMKIRDFQTTNPNRARSKRDYPPHKLSIRPAKFEGLSCFGRNFGADYL